MYSLLHDFNLKQQKGGEATRQKTRAAKKSGIFGGGAGGIWLAKRSGGEEEVRRTPHTPTH
jgi:hypothetical protein